MFSVLFFFLMCLLWDNVGKCVRSRQATDGDVGHALCMLDIWDYRHTLRIWNTSCFSSAATVAWTRLKVMFIVRCFCCSVLSEFHPLVAERGEKRCPSKLYGWIRFLFWLYKVPNIIPGPVRYYDKFSSWRRRPFFRWSFPPSAWPTLGQISLEVANLSISADRTLWKKNTITRHGEVILK
jgi:hypothetical protein